MPPDPTLNIAVLATLAAAAVLWQAVALRSRRSATAGDVLTLLQRPWPLRVALMAGWFWLGWHFFVRGSW